MIEFKNTQKKTQRTEIKNTHTFTLIKSCKNTNFIGRWLKNVHRTYNVKIANSLFGLVCRSPRRLSEHTKKDIDFTAIRQKKDNAVIIMWWRERMRQKNIYIQPTQRS
jgi:hypothetical protein